jgi:glutamyl-tRNA synthetase
MRDQRMHGIPSKCRDLSIQENHKRFQDMTNATTFGLTCCLRAKMSVDDANKALRDPVIYRCNLTPHHRTGNKWKVYPTYDFACPIVDSVEGVTHALRTNEYRDRNAQYLWFIEKLELRHVHIWDYSRMNFVYTLLSKRKLQWFVDQGIVPGWDDPRFPTVRGIRRRGLTIEALKQYILMQGASQNALQLEWDKLWALNKKVIDPVAPRFVALDRLHLCTMHINGGPTVPEVKTMAKHKKNPAIGDKQTVFASMVLLDQADAATLEVGEEITLMDWGNVIVRGVTRDGEIVKSVEADLHLEGDFKKTKKKLTWLAESPGRPLVQVQLLDYDYLITKKKLEENDELQQFITPVTEFKVDGVADANVGELAKGDAVQLERRGYYIVDSVGPVVTLILIPDGKAASTASKAAATTKPIPVKAKVTPTMYALPSVYSGLTVDVSTAGKMYALGNIYE